MEPRQRRAGSGAGAGAEAGAGTEKFDTSHLLWSSVAWARPTTTAAGVAGLGLCCAAAAAFLTAAAVTFLAFLGLGGIPLGEAPDLVRLAACYPFAGMRCVSPSLRVEAESAPSGAGRGVRAELPLRNAGQLEKDKRGMHGGRAGVVELGGGTLEQQNLKRQNMKRQDSERQRPSQEISRDASAAVEEVSMSAPASALRSEPRPLRVYLLPLHGALNFHLLQSEWRFQGRMAISPLNGIPCGWTAPFPQPRQGGLLACPCHSSLGSGGSTELAEQEDDGRMGARWICNDGWMSSAGGGGQGMGVEEEEEQQQQQPPLGMDGGRGGGGVTAVLPEYPRGYRITLEQYSAEYWLTLSLLTGVADSSVMQRVRRADNADIIFVPVFASASYGKKMKENERRRRAGVMTVEDEEHVLEAVTGAAPSDHSADQSADAGNADEGNADGAAAGAGAGAGGAGALWHLRKDDFVFPAVHPWALTTAWDRLHGARFLMVDFSNPSEQVANVDKDVIVPYKAVMPPYTDEDDVGGVNADGGDATTIWAQRRPSLVFFRGRVDRQQTGKVRSAIAAVLANVTGADVAAGEATPEGIASATRGMRSSKFCLSPAGDTTSACRLFDAIMSHCIPVVVSDDIDLPFEDVLDYSSFALFLPEKLAVRPGFIEETLRGMPNEQATAMWQRLKQVKRHFTFATPPLPNGAEEMVWAAIHRRAHGMPYARVNRDKRRKAMGDMLRVHGLDESQLVARPRGLPLT